MRTTSLVMAFGGALLLASGCGAKVIVDGSFTGTGGSTTGTGGNGVGGSIPAFTCDFLCGGPIGVCGCSGSCSDGRTRAVGCGGSGTGTTGFTCTCIVDDVMVGTCDSQALYCQVPGSCCTVVFSQ